jgi:hypothetical protein
MLSRVIWLKVTDVSEVLAVTIVIAHKMEAVSAPETLVSFYKRTLGNIAEETLLHASLRGT